jgi:hypothetical protein
MWEVERMKPARVIVPAGETAEEVSARRVTVSRIAIPAVAPPPAATLDTAPALGTRTIAPCRMNGVACDGTSGQRGSATAIRLRAANMSTPT